MTSIKTSPIRFDEKELSSCFEQRPIAVEHDLADHPLFQIDALLDAGDRLPSSMIECNAGNVQISLPEGKPAGQGLTHREIFDLMPDEKVWLGLKKLDLLPEYRDAIESLLSSVRSSIASSHPGMFNLEVLYLSVHRELLFLITWIQSTTICCKFVVTSQCTCSTETIQRY